MGLRHLTVHPDPADLGTGTPASGKYLDGATGAWTAIPSPSIPAISATTVEKDLGSYAAFAGKFIITDAAISATSKVLCWQAPGPYTGKGALADEAEMQPVQVVSVEPGSGSAMVKWQTPPMVIESPIDSASNALGLGTLANNGNNRDLRTLAKRLGKVRGNVKFSYAVFA